MLLRVIYQKVVDNITIDVTMYFLGYFRDPLSFSLFQFYIVRFKIFQ